MDHQSLTSAGKYQSTDGLEFGSIRWKIQLSLGKIIKHVPQKFSLDLA